MTHLCELAYIILYNNNFPAWKLVNALTRFSLSASSFFSSFSSYVQDHER